ncbi:MAG: glycoside hydrolase, partial [Cyanobacteria bacterium P01_A01_bin.114]
MSDPRSLSVSKPTSEPLPSAQTVSTGVFVCIHGHFYQPPRENPYLESVERQPSAAPFHDWNERILYECYRPNAFARILSDQGEVLHIVNNYEYLSFNIGPTLMSWLERHDIETYRRILDADRKSCDRNNGHGNAIAQVYNHIIMPLANQRDKITQARWGIADFRRRFGRDPEGIWLAETAVDYDTLRVLIQEGIKFTIMAPSQVQRCRPLSSEHDYGDHDWNEVGGGQIDPTRPYRCFVPGLPDGENYIDIFFYDGPISGDMGFSDVLSSSQHFAGRVGQAIRGEHDRAQLISVATDGETFGHHRGGAEKALAYALHQEFAKWGWQVTNYAHYLSLFPPTWEAQLKPVTAWSCAHGVDRWQDDCGCGGGGVWHQQWRKP